MIAEVKGARLLRGFRGRPAADLEALEDTLVRVSHLAMHMEGHLAELDINPLMVLPSGQGEGFRMPVRRDLSGALRAGVRKPPRKEPAGIDRAVCRLWGFNGAAA